MTQLQSDNSMPPTGEKTGAQFSPSSTLLDLAMGGGLARVPGGTYKTYRKIIADPTVALARAATMSPIIAGDWSYQAETGVPDAYVEFIRDQLKPLKPLIVSNCLRALDYGWAPFEKVWDVRRVDGTARVVLRKLKPLLVDITEIQAGKDTGQFHGFKQDKAVVSPESAFLYTYDREGDNYYGRSRLENVRKIITAWDHAEDAAQRYDRKVSGVFLMIHYPPGESKTREGMKSNFEIAQALAQSIGASKPICMPRQRDGAADDRMMEKDASAWKIELAEDKGGRQAHFVDRMAYLDKLKVRGYLRPERSILEGDNGTKAEAGVHGDIGLTDCEQVHEEIVRHVNWYIIDDLLAMNFGEDARGAVYVEPSPIVDGRRSLMQQMITGMVASPEGREQLTIDLDFDAVYDLLGLPVTPIDDREEPEDPPVPGVDPRDPLADELRDMLGKREPAPDGESGA